MSRKKYISKREISPDPKYKDREVAKFINCLMWKGKKSTAQKIFYNAMTIIEKELKEDSLSVFKKALTNCRPLLEVRSRRVGGPTYQVPVEVSSRKGNALGMRWLIDFARKRAGKPMEERLAIEIIEAYREEGAAIRKKEETHKMARANRAFAHYKW